MSGDGVQIIDITDPSNPSPVFAITDGEGGYTELDGAILIVDSSMVTVAHFDDGIQIIDITDPYSTVYSCTRIQS